MAVTKIILAGDKRFAALRRPQLTADARPVLVGWREWLELPDLGIAGIMAKIDTGARTSALHANSIEPFQRDGEPFIRFDVSGEGEGTPWHEALVTDRRAVRSSNGEAEVRYVFRTRLGLGGQAWAVEVSLTKRDRMDVPMLIGREALSGRVLVDPEKSWLCGEPEPAPAGRRSVGRPRTRPTQAGALP